MTNNLINIYNEEEEYDQDQSFVEEEEQVSDYSMSASANQQINKTNPESNSASNKQSLNQNLNDSENINNNNNSNIQDIQQSQQQPEDQIHSSEEEEEYAEEEDTREIQLKEVSKWRKQSQKEQQTQKQQENDSKAQNNNPNINFNNGDNITDEKDQQFNSDNIPDDENILREKFQQFMEEKKQKCVLYLDEGRVNLLPAPLRTPIQNIINTVKRLTARNPTGAPLSALQILAERLDEFLELQEHRTDRDYELRCRDLLSIIYRNTIEAQRLSRQLRDAAAPRSLDEYENY